MRARAVCSTSAGSSSPAPSRRSPATRPTTGCPTGSSARLNATNPDTNAWARLERSEVDFEGFAELFAAEATRRRARGRRPRGAGLLAGELRPAMVEAVRRCHERLKTGLLTNNFVLPDRGRARPSPSGRWRSWRPVRRRRSSRARSGLRKPDPAFYELACRELGVDTATRPCSSTTSASTSSRPGPWA